MEWKSRTFITHSELICILSVTCPLFHISVNVDGTIFLMKCSFHHSLEFHFHSFTTPIMTLLQYGFSQWAIIIHFHYVFVNSLVLALDMHLIVFIESSSAMHHRPWREFKGWPLTYLINFNNNFKKKKHPTILNKPFPLWNASFLDVMNCSR